MLTDCQLLMRWVWIRRLAIGLLAAYLGVTAAASVVLNGTRVIVSGGQRERSVQLSNPDAQPNLVQVWISKSPGQRGEDDVPFLVTPPVFKMEPHAGQMVRLLVLPEKLSATREEMYFLNFSQIPALAPNTENANRMVLTLKSTVKLLHRPPAVKMGMHAAAAQWTGALQSGDVVINNPTPLHMHISNVRWQSAAGRQISLIRQALVVEPNAQFRQSVAPVPGDEAQGDGELWITYVNDYGVEVSIALKPPPAR